MSRVSMPVIIGLVVVGGIGALVLMNTIFYGDSVSLLEQKVVIADIGDFERFIQDCSDDGSSPDEIVTMRDDATGNCLFLRVQVLLKHVYDKKGTHTGQIILSHDDFSLQSGSRRFSSVMLIGGNQMSGEELVIQSLSLRRAADGSIETSMAGGGEDGSEPTLGDLVRSVKGAHKAASIGGGAARGVLDWVPAPLEERSKIIQPPALSGYVWRAARSNNVQDAWKSVEVVCLFPAPPPGSTSSLVVFGDTESAIPIAVN